ncbi:MAG: hypothetical protein ING36_09680, partial [Burkholderiales bacterium]|nr:hypothetical protein [Burkholderiales bacterium]
MKPLTQKELAGRIYFVVGRGTEGGNASYRLSVAGIAESKWQAAGGQNGTNSTSLKVKDVADNSGYTIGAMQLDMGARGLLKVGSTSEIAKSGEQSYVDAVIEQSKAYAAKNNLRFPNETDDLRDALLTKGNGLIAPNGKQRSSITFIDPDIRDVFNAWAGSSEGRNWIHQYVDMPIIYDAASKALNVVEKYGTHWTEDEKNLAAIELAKVYNQTGNLSNANVQLKALSTATSSPSFSDLTTILSGNRDAPKALDIGIAFQKALDSKMSEWIESAQRKVIDPDFDPAQFATDPDLKLAVQLSKSGSKSVAVNDGQLSIKVNEQLYRYTMSEDGNTVNFDVVKNYGTKQEIIVGGVCYNNQAVLKFTQVNNNEVSAPTPSLWDPAQDWLNDNLVQPIKDAAQVGKDWVQQNLIDPIQDYFDDDKANSTTVTRPGE